MFIRLRTSPYCIRTKRSERNNHTRHTSLISIQYNQAMAGPRSHRVSTDPMIFQTQSSATIQRPTSVLQAWPGLRSPEEPSLGSRCTQPSGRTGVTSGVLENY
ncbi:predicted protein [Histoplasma capsulatum G186AR]|uniref:Uncharacterized protein n=1 Tax=Ajellomyces capsulatus (strain G186AR / H82 / ATCC MYA-2454 / RMSCC 2432) TaxID=447093 RepID=C0NNZ8_AJECG|nr:uncharacterized protein HCBG_04878 [Histoplasma capsulatum G186AR]EEH06658.1 predicted protein [Histoplasma capsulatum G186AR]